MNTGRIISGLCVIVINAFILKYVYDLEKLKCECAFTLEHKMIKVLAPIIMGVTLILMFLSNKTFVKAFKNKGLKLLMGLYNLTALTYAVTLIVYFSRLVHTRCACSEDWKRWALLYPILGLVLGVILFLIVFFLTLMGVKLPRMSKGNKNLRSTLKKALK